MNIRHKPLGMLKSNIRILPSQIAEWRKKGQTDKAAQGEAILANCVAEVARRAGK